LKQTMLEERYPIFVLEIGKEECRFLTLGEIVDHLRQQIEGHRLARFITIFDHFAHTQGLEEGDVDERILDAHNIVFCFGIALPSPEAMAVRPRSIGVVELVDRFVITFLEAPMPVANVVMENWARSLIRA